MVVEEVVPLAATTTTTKTEVGTATKAMTTEVGGMNAAIEEDEVVETGDFSGNKPSSH